MKNSGKAGKSGKKAGKVQKDEQKLQKTWNKAGKDKKSKKSCKKLRKKCKKYRKKRQKMWIIIKNLKNMTRKLKTIGKNWKKNQGKGVNKLIKRLENLKNREKSGKECWKFERKV